MHGQGDYSTFCTQSPNPTPSTPNSMDEYGSFDHFFMEHQSLIARNKQL